MWNAKATHIFLAKNINVFSIFQDRNFNINLAVNLVKKFEQLGPAYALTLKGQSQLQVMTLEPFLPLFFVGKNKALGIMQISHEMSSLLFSEKW